MFTFSYISPWNSIRMNGFRMKQIALFSRIGHYRIRNWKKGNLWALGLDNYHSEKYNTYSKKKTKTKTFSKIQNV